MTHKRSLSLLALMAAVASLAGCASNQRGAEEEVKRNLKDPASAQFGDFYLSIGVQKGPPIGVQKGPPSSSSVTGMTGALFVLVAA